MEIIDTHLHTWDLSRFRLPWLDSEGPVLNRSWSLEDYAKAADGYHIGRAVYIEVDVDHAERPMENEFVSGLIAGGGTVLAAASISGDLTSADFPSYLNRWGSLEGVRGFRQVLHVPSSPRGTCLSETYAANVRALGERGLLFEGCVRNPELHDLATLARRCPGTTMVLDHMGIVDADIIAQTKPDEDQRRYQERWKRNMDELGSLPNVACKISGLNPTGAWTTETLGRAVKVAIDSFAPDKLMFASNFPVLNVAMSLGEWINAMLDITSEMSVSDRDALFHGNAERIYGL